MKSNRLALFLIWLMMLVAYFDRVNITIAGPEMMKSLHMSKLSFGVVLSSFTLGYASMQIPGGWLADRFGPRWILVAALTIWSAFTALTGRVMSLRSLIGVRVAFGVGEGIENGAQFKLIADRFGPRERSAASALFLTALALGPAIALPVSARLIASVGWRGLFLWFAVAGVIVAVVLAALLPRSPVRAESGDSAGARAGRAAAWRELAARPDSWLKFAAYLFFNIAFWGFLSWMPTYLSQTRHVTLAKLGWISSIPYVVGFVGMLTMGALGSRALFRWRAPMTAAGYLLGGVCLALAFRAAHVSACVAALSASAFFLYGGFGPFWAIAMDGVADEVRGSFSGFVNFGGQVGGFIAPMAVGAIVTRTHSFTGGFLFMIAALVVSAGSLSALHVAGRFSRTRRSGTHEASSAR